MNTTIDQAQGRVPVTILRLEGDLDGSNYEQLIAQGRNLSVQGTRHLLIDMRKVPYMGSSGLVALHAIALMLAGNEPPDVESGWEAHHAVQRSVESGMQPHLKLLLLDAPGSSVKRVVERTGMDRFIETHTDEATAIASFGPADG